MYHPNEDFAVLRSVKSFRQECLSQALLRFDTFARTFADFYGLL